MLTKELLGKIAEETGLNKKRTEELLAASNSVIRENLMSGNAVQLQGLGSMEIKTKKERTMVHPRTGERTIVPSKNQLVFHPASGIKDEFKKL